MYLKKALRGTVIVFILSLLGGLFGYLMRILLARQLTVAEFGLFYSVITIFMFFAYFIDAGFGQAVSRKIVELKLHNKQKTINNLIFSVLSIQLILSFVICMLLFIFSDFLSNKFFHYDVSSFIIILSIWLITLPLISLFLYTFYGFKKSELYSLLDTIKYFLLLIISWVGLFFGFNTYAPVWAYLITNIILVIICFFIIKRVFPYFSFKFTFDMKLGFEVFKFGLIIFISNFAWFVITQTDTMILTYFTNSTQVGLYQIALPLVALLLYLTNALVMVTYPIVSELKLLKDNARLLDGINFIYTYLFICLLPLVAFMFSFPDVIISLFFTSKYLGAVTITKILAISSIFFSLAIINNTLLTALGKPAKVAKMMLFVALFNLILCLVLVPIYGIIGAATSTLVSFFFASIFSSYQISKNLNFKLPIAKWIILSVIVIALMFLINFLKLKILLNIYPKILLIVIIFVILYLLILLSVRLIKLSEIKLFYVMLFKK
jgi:O-antigen/teichoic acid export membrane protein